LAHARLSLKKPVRALPTYGSKTLICEFKNYQFVFFQLYQVNSFNVLLHSYDLLDISFNTLHFFVAQKYLSRCCEYTLIRSVEQWAKHHLENKQIPADFENMRIILGPVISKLRFLSLKQKELVSLFKDTLLLSEKEKLELLERSVTNIRKPLVCYLSASQYSR